MRSPLILIVSNFNYLRKTWPGQSCYFWLSLPEAQIVMLLELQFLIQIVRLAMFMIEYLIWWITVSLQTTTGTNLTSKIFWLNWSNTMKSWEDEDLACLFATKNVLYIMNLYLSYMKLISHRFCYFFSNSFFRVACYMILLKLRFW